MHGSLNQRMKFIISYSFIFFIFSVIVLFTVKAQAGVIMYGTRIIYNEDKPFVTVRLANNDNMPNLMQVWVDDGSGRPPSGANKIPFVVTPPLFRMNGKTQQTVRVTINGLKSSMPTDRESLFWFNFLQIPPENQKDKGMAKITLSFLNQVKLIYRPAGIKGRAEDIASNLKFRIKIKNGHQFLEATNSTGFYATFFDKALLKTAVTSCSVDFNKNVTLPPFSSLEWKAGCNSPLNNAVTFNYSLINDTGSLVKNASPVQAEK